MVTHLIFTDKVKKEIMYDLAEAIVTKAKNMCPTDTGELLASIQYTLSEGGIVIWSNDPNFMAMEYGEPPSVLRPQEKADITKWAKRHGVENPKGTAGYIAEHGIEVGSVKHPLHVTWQGRNSYRPFMRPAIHQTIPEFKNIVKGVLL